MNSRVQSLLIYSIMILCYGSIAWAEHRFQISQIIEANRPAFIRPDVTTAVMLLPVNLSWIRNLSIDAIYYFVFMICMAVSAIFFKFSRRTDLLFILTAITIVYLTIYGLMSSLTLLGYMKITANQTTLPTHYRLFI